LINDFFPAACFTEGRTADQSGRQYIIEMKFRQLPAKNPPGQRPGGLNACRDRLRGS
jgi:hypothetical protein